MPNGCCHHKIPGEKRGAGCRICSVHFLPVESLELPRHVSQSVVRVKSWSSLKPGWVSGGRLVGCLGRNSSLSSKCRWFLKVNTLSIFSGSVRSMGSFCASLVLCLNLDTERTAFSVLGSYSPSTPQIWKNVRYEGWRGPPRGVLSPNFRGM